MIGLWNNGVKQKVQAYYLFPNFDNDNTDFSHLLGLSEKETEERVANFGTNTYITESDKDVFKVGISFDSLHYMLSDLALLAGFLMPWLKCCVVPTAPKAIGVAYPAVLLTHEHPLSLLLAMVCDVRNGLRILIE